MELITHFQLLARYNRIANERLFAACAQLDDAEYRKPRAGSFGIHRLLNHILLGDRRWMALFENGQLVTPPLDEILYHEFPALRIARAREDERIESFFAGLEPVFWDRSFAYTNNRGKDYVETAQVACSHLFNHQTHHRAQVHVMLSQTSIAPPSLDLHRILNPQSLMAMIRTFWLLTFTMLAQAADPIRVHPGNPHYFEFRGKPAVLITSGEHYGAVLNLDFDYKRYLRTLAADRLNLTRTFTGAYREGPESFNITGNTLAPAHDRFIAPWPRTDVTGALDGLKKFDLTRWNDAYFSRLKNFMKEAAAHGIVVELALFCPFYRDEMWNLSPLNAGNNINGIGNYRREQVYTLEDPEMQRVQDALVKKIVAELRDFENLMYEISNEPYTSKLITADWERHISGIIAEAEAGFPPRKRHFITQNISNGSQKVPDPNPHVSVFNFHYSRPPLSVALNRDLSRPIGCNETGFDGQADATYRVQGWEFILAGGALFNNLDYSFSAGREDGTFSYPAKQPGGGSAALRRQLRALRDFMDSIDFVRMSPISGFVQSGLPEGSSVWALGNPRKAYALYLHHGAPRKGTPRYFVDATPTIAKLTVDLPAGQYAIEWVDPKSGKVVKQERVQHKGEVRELVSPQYSEDIALRISAR